VNTNFPVPKYEPVIRASREKKIVFFLEKISDNSDNILVIYINRLSPQNSGKHSSDANAKRQFLHIKGFADFYSTIIIYRGNGPK
jgi:hypothetical protein